MILPAALQIGAAAPSSPIDLITQSSLSTKVVLGILIVLSLALIPDARGTVWMSIPLAAVFLGLVTGLALIVACVNVLYRDVEHILAAALLPWFFLTPVLWRFEDLPPHVQSHHKLLELLRWGNFVTPPIYAVRDPIWLGKAPRAADAIYLVVAAAVALALGAFVFSRVDDRIAVEL